MDDDIDIEEHDVLDNPKIRDIFPDLSLVKIEVPDAEDTLDEYEEMQSYNSLLYESNIKKENISDDEQNDSCQYGQIQQSDSYHYGESDQEFEQSDPQYSQIDQSEPLYGINESREYEQSETSFENGDIDFEQNGQIAKVSAANKLILGSKPDYDTLYNEALNSNVSVYLENWDLQLKTSPCFCQNCEILFPTVNALDAHNSTSHSFLVPLDTKPNMARKSTSSTPSRYCNHCDKTFPNDTALITHLYELLPLNKIQSPTPQPVKIESKLLNYKCQICQKYFLTFADGKKHKLIAHPNLNINIIKSVLKTKKVLTDKNSVPKIKVEKQIDKTHLSSCLVPKSLMFKCEKCHILFLSCYSAIQHSRKCGLKADFSVCRLCHGKISYRYKHYHEIQHKLGEKFKIYTVEKSITEKVLAKCPKCSVCFDEKKFWCHQKECDGIRNSFTHCNSCNIDINDAKYELHAQEHELKKYKKKDFIVIEFVHYNGVKNNMLSHKLESYVTLYYCENCGMFLNRCRHSGHRKGNCSNTHVYYCVECGLGFSKKTILAHRELHRRHKLTLNDFKIISLNTGKHLDLPMPNFYQCKSCNVHYIYERQLIKHICPEEAFEICLICNKKFNGITYRLHNNFHNVQNLSELIEKYNSLHSTWNILFVCVTCDLVTMTYDSTVEHCQAHINNMSRPPTVKCPICQFDVLKECYNNHQILHKNNKNIGRDDFLTLSYNYNNLFNKQWMGIFDKLSKQDKYYILSRSVYRYTRRFKLNYDKSNLSHETKLFCSRCKTNIQMQGIKKHYIASCKYSSKYKCTICKVTFKNLQEYTTHEANHDNRFYKIITFNDEKDKQFNLKLKEFQLSTNNNSDKNKIKSSIPKILQRKYHQESIPKTLNKLNRFELFKCSNCHCCVSVVRNITRHKCITKMSLKKKCKICKQTFFIRQIHKHIAWHIKYPKIYKHPIIIDFNPQDKLPLAYIYQCTCGLNFTTQQLLDKHAENCHDEIEISKEKCSKCNLVFPTNVLVSHLCKHHTKPTNIEIKVIKNTKMSYQCPLCKIVFSNLTNFEHHLFTCPVIKYSTECPDCGLRFDLKSYSGHSCGEKMSIVTTEATASVIFHCTKCDINYLYKNSLGYHLEVKHVSQRTITKCEKCNLRFTEQIMEKHNTVVHPNDNFIVKVIDWDTKKFKIIKGKEFRLNIVDDQKCLKEMSGQEKKCPSVDKKMSGQERKGPSVDKRMSGQEMKCPSVDKKMSGQEKKCPSVDKRMSGQEKKCPSVDKRMSGQEKKCPSVNKKMSKNENRDLKPLNISKLEIQNVDASNKNGKNMSSNVKMSKARYHRVFKCGQCNMCYLFKKSWDYHRTFGHVNNYKRKTFECNVCGLLFPDTSKINHMKIHRKSNYYIEIYELDTEQTTRITVKNMVGKNIKRKLSDNIDATVVKKPKVTDENDGFEEPSTSRIDFESVTMSESFTSTFVESPEESTADPLNNTTETELKLNISEKLKSILNSKMSAYSNDLYKCPKCKLHFMVEQSILSHLARGCKGDKTDFHTCEKCHLNFTTKTFRIHKYVHHMKMKLNIENLDITLISDNYDCKKYVKNTTINYFKCGDCNVCFINEDDCKNHFVSHKILDSIYYIECKLCHYQFLIDDLKTHIDIHHSDGFCIDNVVVTEYRQSQDRHRFTKIKIYNDSDKLQSKQVSTTTDSV